jgi:flagellar hook assembly protein FlgD
MQMEITLDSSIVAIQAYNHPNPMKRNGTNFYFATGMPSSELEYGENLGSKDDRLEFEIRIFNQAGRLVQVFENAHSGEAHWDGRDRWGNQLANGVYFYKITGTQVRFDLEERPGFTTVSSKYNTLVLSR